MADMKKPKFFGENEFRLALEEMAALLNGAELVLPLENKNASYLNQDVGQVDVDILLDGADSSELILSAAIKIGEVRVKSILARGDKIAILKWLGENAGVEHLQNFLMNEYKNIYMHLDRIQFDRE